MRPQGLDDLGDEPIYCEAHHDDAVYSGSEDDYYEAPEHRRLRIEAKAVQFLTGNLPYLLSATLQGPFDNKSWDNPWKSKRAQRGARRRVSHSRRSLEEVEAPTAHGSGKAIDDLPDAQRTSLYPLPSPEITNPPSARKNAFMDESQYSRVKTWREAVTSIPVTKDPFWASRQGESENAHVTKKRSADENWLHTRGSKKRKSVDKRRLLLTESPSQAAAKTRSSHDRLSENMTQSLSISSSCEYSLATLPVAQSASFGSSRLANVTTETPELPQTARNPQFSKRQLPYREPEMSEDELSMPSPTGPMQASRSLGQKSMSPTNRRSLTRQKRAANGDSASHTYGGKINDEKMIEQAWDSRFSLSQCPGMNMAKTSAKDVAGRALEASQQDNSFYFHAKPKNPADQPEAYQHSTSPKDRTTLSLPSAQMRVLVSAEDMIGEGDGPQPEDSDDLVMPHAEIRTDLVKNVGQNTPHKTDAPPGLTGEAGTGVLDGPGAVHEATTPHTKEAHTEDTIQRNQESDAAKHLPQKDNETCVKPDTDRSAFVCTQELSPVSMHGSTRPAGTVAVSDEAVPQGTPSADNDAVAASEWSTYINTQDSLNASEKLLSHACDTEGMKIVSHGPGDPTDPDWTTFVDTQDPTAEPAEPAEGGKAAGEVDEVEVVEQGSDDPSDPEWSTILNTQDQFAARKQQHEGLEDEKGDAMGIDAIEQGDGSLVVQDDVVSNSDWSTYMSASSQIIADQTRSTSHEPVQPEESASETKPSQVSVGAIINAYAEESHLSSEEIKHAFEGNAVNENLQDSVVVSTSQEDNGVPESVVQPRQESRGPIENQEDTAVPSAQSNSDEQAVPQPDQVEQSTSTDLDATTASIESTQSQTLSKEETGHALQAPRPSRSGTEALVDPAAAHGTPASVEPRHIQNPWQTRRDMVLQTPAARVNGFTVLDETNANIEATTFQSPWAKESIGPPVCAVLDNDTTLNESPSNLSMLAGKALTLSEAPQTPWLGDKLPSPNFSLSVKRFSDFMKPSPTKKRVSANGSILRGSSMSSHVLFGTPVPLEPRRRVTFAPLPGEKEAGLADVGSKDKDEFYVEEDVSYFDIKGKKMSSIRVARPKTRAASPPPSQVNGADAGELPDHDHKFAKHFEIMSKRKKNLSRKMPRLLPPDSQQTNASQEVGAMAEAFIEASQTRKRTAELVEASANGNPQSDDPPAAKNLSPVAINPVEEQENVEPVDDVSAVLDNLSYFFDHTWGVDTSMDIDAEVETSVQQQQKTASKRFDNVGDPLLSLNVNIWAD